jgi:hypothetical protein
MSEPAFLKPRFLQILIRLGVEQPRLFFLSSVVPFENTFDFYVLSGFARVAAFSGMIQSLVDWLASGSGEKCKKKIQKAKRKTT